MSGKEQKVLFLCYGNPARLDDSLGPAFGSRLERDCDRSFTIEVGYQLSPEDAETISRYDHVVFVDAAVSGPEPFSFSQVLPKSELSHTTHFLRPEDLLALARRLFGARTEGYCLGIRGYKFDDFGETISTEASRNLNAALEFARELLEHRRFSDAVLPSPLCARRC